MGEIDIQVFEAEIMGETHVTFFALHKGRVVGQIALFFIPDIIESPAIFDWFVAPDMRGRGIGLRILSSLRKYCTEINLERFYVSYVPDGRDIADMFLPYGAVGTFVRHDAKTGYSVYSFQDKRRLTNG